MIWGVTTHFAKAAGYSGIEWVDKKLQSFLEGLQLKKANRMILFSINYERKQR